MLRLAHKIATTKIEQMMPWSDACNSKTLQAATEHAKRLQDVAAGSPSLRIDNVADWFAEFSDDELDLFALPAWKPPFDDMTIEWKMITRTKVRGEWVNVSGSTPSGQCGAIVRTLSLEDAMALHRSADESRGVDDAEISKIIGECGGAVLFDIFIDKQTKPVVWVGLTGMFFLSKEGLYRSHILIALNPNAVTAEMPPALHEFYYLAVLGLAFCGCKNVVRLDVTESDGPKRKWLRRMKAPTIRYHVLNIDPMKEIIRREGNPEATGINRALHLCRGHFAVYSADKPLFGKYTGQFWRPSHVRGSAAAGIVDKDYKIRPIAGIDKK